MPSQVPSDVPTAKPSPSHSLAPSEVPTSAPTMSIKPSPSPSAAPIAPSPKPTPAPTGTPTSSPTGTPTTPLPTQGPTIKCVDSALRLKIQEGSEKISRSCVWVGRKDVKNRCALDGVAAACPVTCGTCSVCEDPDALLRFRFEYDGVSIVRSCDYAARKSTNLRCAAMGDVCRKTCGKC